MINNSLATPVSRKLRLQSMIGDHVIMCMVCIPIAMLLFPVVAKEAFCFMMVPYLSKDFLRGRSPAKRLLGLQLQDAAGAPINELRASLRNVTAIMWPIEVLLIAAGSQKRLGDYIAGAQVVVSAPVTNARSWKQDLVDFRVTFHTVYTLLAILLYLLLLDIFFTWIGL